MITLCTRTEHTNSILIFTVVTVFSILFFIYYSFLTTYVLLIEIVIGVIGIFFGTLELIMSVAAIVMFAKANAA